MIASPIRKAGRSAPSTWEEIAKTKIIHANAPRRLDCVWHRKEAL
jgi:hypothetical protein